MIQLWSLALLLLFTSINATGKFNKLNRILSSLTIDLPTLTEDIALGDVTVPITLFKLNCTGLTLQDIQVETEGTRLVGNVTNAAISCHGHYNFTLFGKHTGTVFLTSQTSSFFATVAIDKDNQHQLPSSARLSACDAEIEVKTLHFQGGGQMILNGASPFIIKLVKSLVNGNTGVLCQTLTNLTATTVTSLVHNISEALQPYLPVPGETPLPWQEAETRLLATLDSSEIQSLANIQNNTFVELLHWFIKLELGAPTPCFLSFLGPVGSLGINNLITTATKNRPMNVTLSPPITLIDANLMHSNNNNKESQDDKKNGVSLHGIDLTVNVTSLAIAGLNTFTAFNILRPVSPYTLQSDVDVASLDVDLALAVTYKTTTARKEQHAHVIVRVLNLKQISLNLSTLVVVDETYLNQLPVRAALAHVLGCASHSVMEANLTQVEFSVVSTGLPPTVAGALSPELDVVLENILALVTTSWVCGPCCPLLFNVVFTFSIEFANNYVWNT